MPSIINALSTGVGGLVQTADASGVLQLQSNGTTALTVDTAQKTTINNLSATAYSPATSLLTSGTAQNTTSGTSIDFTGIPSWVKRITVMFNGVSTNGVSTPQIQIGAGSAETTGYSGLAWNNTGGVFALSSTGFSIASANASANLYGQAVFTLVGSNLWVMQTTLSSPGSSAVFVTSGAKTTSGALTIVRITTVNGTDTFDAGSVNILYE